MANNVTALDASGATQTFKTTDNSGVHTPHGNVDKVIPGTAATELGKAVDATVGGTDTGVAALAKRVDTPATITPANGDYTNLTVDPKGRLHIVPEVIEQAGTSGGCSNYHKKATADTNTAVIKNAAGQVYGLQVFNFKAATIYVKLYDKATTPNLASDVPVAVYPFFQIWMQPMELSKGIQFTNGIAIAITAGIADNDTTALAANDCILNLQYK